jgi:hypothetical protein
VTVWELVDPAKARAWLCDHPEPGSVLAPIASCS